MPTWIFQAKPDDYNLPNALRCGDPQVWRVSRYREEIAVGDRVFLWEGGSGRAILAVARIESAPEDQEFPDQQFRFVVGETRAEKQRKFGRDAYAAICVERNLLPRRISADRLKTHPVLRRLSILKMAQATNFKVPDDLARELEQFVAAWPPADYP